ncbi:MAG: outer membrane beta-barrel protein [Acidobacteria bacterium]|nr:outer membrane beta-barrel protein [Acidobacteriota bacterium]
MKLLRISAVLCLFLGVTSLANAQTTADLPRGNVSGFGSFALSASDGLDKGYGGGASGAYFFTDAIGFEGAFSTRTFDVAATGDNQLSGGEVSTNILSLNLIGRFATGSIQPYVSGGVAFFMYDYTIDSVVASQLAQFNFTANEEIENTIGFNFAGGADFQFSDRVGAFVEGRYTIATADTTGGLTDQITNITAATAGEQQFSVFTFNGGIRIFF